MNKYVVIIHVLMLILLSIQPVELVWKGLYVVIWAGFSFLYWKRAKGSIDNGIKIPDIIFYLSILMMVVLNISAVFIPFVLICFFAYENRKLAAANMGKLQTLSIAAAQREIEKMNEMFRSVRSQRHDSMKHLSAIHFLLEQNRVQEANDYLNEYIGKINEMGSAIKGEDGHIASALFQLLQQAKLHQISVSLHCQIALSALPMSQVDQISVLMNLLENSIDAAKESVEKDITVKTSIHSGIYVLEVINSTLPMQNQVLFSQFEQTNKGGSHQGLGTWIIKQLVDEYNGVIDYHYRKPFFTIKVKLPIVVGERREMA